MVQDIETKCEEASWLIRMRLGKSMEWKNFESNSLGDSWSFYKTNYTLIIVQVSITIRLMAASKTEQYSNYLDVGKGHMGCPLEQL